jgi:hypothetical protein
MATGDDALAAGMDTVDPVTDLVKDGAEEINKTRDYLAQRTSEVIPVASGGTGATNAAGARTNLGLAGTVSAVAAATPLATGLTIASRTADGRLNVGTPSGSENATPKSYVDAGLSQKAELDTVLNIRAGELSQTVWNRDIITTRRAVWMSSPVNGFIDLGYASSARAKKQDFRDAELTYEQLLAIPVLQYRYRKAVAAEKRGGERAQTEIGTTADQLHELGLWQFVIYEGRGEDATPVGVHYDLLSLAAISLGQKLAAKLSDLESRVVALESR